MIKNQNIPEWKLKEVNQLTELFKKYDNVAVIPLSKIPDRQVQSMRKTLRGDAILRMSKRSLQTRAIEKYQKESGKENLDKLEKNIPGQSSLLFTNMDIFELKKLFEENKWMIAASPNEPAPSDIIVKKGDTGLPTGQVISELNVTLKLPTRIENDTIWIREDTVTHEEGEKVSVKEAAVLKKLGIRPVESVIKIHYAWCDEEILPKSVIYMDTGKFKQDIASHFQTALTIALELEIVDEETIEPLLQKAYRQGLGLMFEMPIIVGDMIDEYIKKAESTAATINSLVFGVQEKESSIEREEKKTEEEKEDEEAGMGDLFGGDDGNGDEDEDEDEDSPNIGGLF
ncbi:MAG: 50S ribosomal protein L10 [Promethearchaeia archaeon]